MTERSISTYWKRIRQDAAEYGRLVSATLVAWRGLAWQLVRCLWLTLRLAGRTGFWLVRLVWPVPTTIDEYGRRRRNWNNTGLAIPAGDLLTLVAGVVLVAGYYL